MDLARIAGPPVTADWKLLIAEHPRSVISEWTARMAGIVMPEPGFLVPEPGFRPLLDEIRIRIVIRSVVAAVEGSHAMSNPSGHSSGFRSAFGSGRARSTSTGN